MTRASQGGLLPYRRLCDAEFRGAWHLSKHFWNCCIESVPVSLVNPHPCWEQLFLETMKVILAKFGQWGHSRAGGCGDGVVWTDNQLVFYWAFPMWQAHSSQSYFNPRIISVRRVLLLFLSFAKLALGGQEAGRTTYLADPAPLQR